MLRKSARNAVPTGLTSKYGIGLILRRTNRVNDKLIDYRRFAGSVETVGFIDRQPVTITLHPDGSTTQSRPCLPEYNYAVHKLLMTPTLTQAFEERYDANAGEWAEVFDDIITHREQSRANQRLDDDGCPLHVVQR